MEDYAAIYGELHRHHKWFRGFSVCAHVDDIRRLIVSTGSKSILDYGCGKGLQYSERRMHEDLGVEQPYCFDVGVPEFSARPVGRFDGVLCCDVMEHIAEPDTDAVLKDVMGFADKFVFLRIGCVPSRKDKTLPDGRNVHLTVRPEEWWAAKIERLRPKNIVAEVRYDARVRGDEIQVPFEMLRPSAPATNYKLMLHLWAELKRDQRFRKPLIVSPASKGAYTILMGNHRYAAMKNAGWAAPVACVLARDRDEVAAARLLRNR
jgi:hypothetical protein